MKFWDVTETKGVLIFGFKKDTGKQERDWKRAMKEETNESEFRDIKDLQEVIL